MVSSELDLAETISLARQLDPFGLGQLHDAYYAPVFRYINFRLYDKTISQRLADELFGLLLVSWNKIGKEPHELSAWLFTTAAGMVDEVDRHSQPPDPDEPNTAAANDPLAEEIAWLGALMRKALASLETEQQHLLALRFCGSQSLADVSRLTGKSLSEMRTLQYTALETLRKLLESEAHAE